MESEPAAVNWRRIGLAAYGPSMLVSVGVGAVLPLVAISAQELGAGVGMSALVFALLGVGQLIGDLPAGQLAARFGEKRALIGACVIDAAALALAWQARAVWVLAIAVAVSGMCSALFGLARQAYLTEVVPVHQRARAMSTLGGVFRIGWFIGPLIAAAVVAAAGLSAAYAVAAVMSLAAAVLTGWLPDLPRTEQAQAEQAQSDQPQSPGRQPNSPARSAAKVEHGAEGSPGAVTMGAVFARHRAALLTLGLGCLLLIAARQARLSLIPLWANHNGIDPEVTSIIFSASALCEVLLFYPGGAIMDRFGRFWVVVPTLVLIGIGFAVLPLAHTVPTIVAVAVLIGIANGVSSGIVMTLGSDATPVRGRSQFLAWWRLFSDAGGSGGPLAISVIAAIAPLAVAVWAMAAVSLFGGIWFTKWLPRSGPPVRRLPKR